MELRKLGKDQVLNLTKFSLTKILNNLKFKIPRFSKFVFLYYAVLLAIILLNDAQRFSRHNLKIVTDSINDLGLLVSSFVQPQNSTDFEWAIRIIF